MPYFVFLKNLENLNGICYHIAENEEDLNNSNIVKLDYKIIEDSLTNFESVKFGSKVILGYNDNNIIYSNNSTSFLKKEDLQNYVNFFKNKIKQFTDNNLYHPLFNRWNDYYIQLNNLNLDNINYPLDMSLEQYFKDLGQPSFSSLQVP
jgi:hypothetical protein